MAAFNVGELAAPAGAAAVGGAGVAAAGAAMALDTPVVDAAAIAGFSFERYKADIDEVSARNTELVTAILAVRMVHRREYRLAVKGPAVAAEIACIASEVERPAEAVIKDWHAPVTAPALTEVEDDFNVGLQFEDRGGPAIIKLAASLKDAATALISYMQRKHVELASGAAAIFRPDLAAFLNNAHIVNRLLQLLHAEVTDAAAPSQAAVDVAIADATAFLRGRFSGLGSGSAVSFVSAPAAPAAAAAAVGGAAVVAPRGGAAAIGGAEGAAGGLGALRPYMQTATWWGHSGFLVSMLVLPGDRLCTTSADKTIKIWDTSRRTAPTCIASLEGHTGTVRGLVQLPDGSLASTSDDATIRIWSLETGACLRVLRGHVGVIYCAAYLVSADLLVTGGDDRNLRFWNYSTGELVRSVPAHASTIGQVFELSDGRLASSALDKKVEIRNIETGALYRTLPADGATVTTFLALDDGTIVTGGHEGKLLVWNFDEDRIVRRLTGHRLAIWRLARLPSGHIVSASEDKTVRIWNPYTGECLQTLDSAVPVYTVAATEDGVLFSAGQREEHEGTQFPITRWAPRP